LVEQNTTETGFSARDRRRIGRKWGLRNGSPRPKALIVKACGSSGSTALKTSRVMKRMPSAGP
jgi:hypothetical protein